MQRNEVIADAARIRAIAALAIFYLTPIKTPLEIQLMEEREAVEKTDTLELIVHTANEAIAAGIENNMSLATQRLTALEEQVSIVSDEEFWQEAERLAPDVADLIRQQSP